MTGAGDVLLVVIDSARKDRLSAYEHDRPTTPALADLAASATRYENAFTPAPWTLPSHCSLFTGRYPSEHGITNGFTDRNLALSTELPTLPERLSERGYATAGFSNNPWVGQLSGLDRGFDRFVEWDLEITRSERDADPRRRDAVYSRLHALLGRAAGQPQALLKRRFFTSNLVERAVSWLQETRETPTFTFLNLMEAHSPYYPPKSAFRELGLDPPGAIETRTLNAKLLAYVMGKRDLDPSTRERVMEFYDASLRYQDGKLAELLGALRAAGRYEDATIVICADHGKTLGDVDRDATPPHYVRDINVNVPLLVKWPNRTRARRIAAPVELTDCFEALTEPDSTGLPAKTAGALVEDHVPHTASESTDVERWRVLADKRHKYVRSEDGQDFLFDRRGEDERLVDADEGDRREYRNRLGRRVDSLAAASGPTSDSDADGDLRSGVERQLEDLGYLS